MFNNVNTVYRIISQPADQIYGSNNEWHRKIKTAYILNVKLLFMGHGKNTEANFSQNVQYISNISISVRKFTMRALIFTLHDHASRFST